MCCFVPDGADQSVVLQKVLECVSVIMECHHGKIFFEMHRNTPHLAVHLHQDIQLIIASFADIANSIDLHKAVMVGNPILAMANCTTPLAIANGLIRDLCTLVNGNKQFGKVGGAPCCVPWFAGATRPPAVGQGGPGPDERQLTDCAPDNAKIDCLSQKFWDPLV